MTFLKTLGAATVAVSLLALPAKAEGTLSVYHWFEYIPQELLDKFTKETGISVKMDTYDSNESLLASLKGGTLGSYDVAVPGDYMVQILKDEGMLDTFESSELKNFGNIDETWLNVPFDNGRKHSIPYQWGTTSFAVNRDVFKGDINTTDILFSPPDALKGKINMLDSQGEVILMGQLHLGLKQCSSSKDDLKKLDALLQGAKQHWASFGSDTAKEVLVSGDAAVGQIWNGFSAKARVEGANIEYAYPKQGYVAWMDNVVLLKNAPNRAAALKFMDFLLVPENAAAVTNYAQYAAGVKGVKPFLSKELQTSPESNPPASAPVGTFIETCDQGTQELYNAVWTRLKK